MRKLGVEADREKRIHRARYAAIARECAIVSAQHLSRFDTPRRLATLAVFAREMEARLIDAALGMFGKMLGSVFRRADRAHDDNVAARAKTLDASARALLVMAKAMLAAKDFGQDQIAAVETALGWERLKIVVSEVEAAVADTRPDNLGEVVESISPIRSSENEAADGIIRRLYAMLPRLRITELFAEVHGWTGFADRFAHLRTGTPPDDARALMTAVLADATNLGLTRMARNAGDFSHSRLLWIAEWHVRDETYQAALACLVDAIHAQPFNEIWGYGDTSSSDGQFFRAGGHGEARADFDAKYGSEPGVKFYTDVSDRYAPFYSKVIAANASEAAHVLDGLMHHESSIDIREHYTDAAGAVDHVFGLCHLLGFRFAPRIRDLADRKLYVVGARGAYKRLDPTIGGAIDVRIIAENWDEILRLSASIEAGTVAPSAILRRLAAYPRQNALAKALREVGRLERTLFTLDWISDPALRRRSNAGLNKGEARNALARAVFFHRLGEIRDRTFENQRYRASGLNLAVAAIILWNSVYLGRAVDELRSRGETIPEETLAHAAPLAWEHIAFNGDYAWPAEPIGSSFRPLRIPRAEFLDAA